MRRASLLLRLLGGLAALLAAAARGAVGCGVPTRLRFAELRNEYKNQNNFSVEETAKYTCRPGYRRDPQLQPAITCLENGSWSKALEFCKKKSCGHPGEPENGRVIVTDIHFGSTVNFTCEEGHRLVGQPYRRCEISGRQVAWTGDVPICERIPCLPPPDIPNGRHTGVIMEDFSYGSVVTYKCDNGYPLTGEASIHCTTKDGLNGEWSARPPRCGEVRCPAPQIQNGRRVSGDRRVYLYNDSVTFECDPGYTVKGHSLSRCQTDDTWDPPLPVCEPEVLCIAPAIQNGRKVAGRGPVYRPKDTVRFECDPGYTLNGSRQIQCRDEGIWDPPVPVCTQTTCVSPEVEHGRTNGVQRAYRPRDMVVFECDAGYTLSGSAETECQDDGRWDPRVPTCERTVQCVSPPAIANGKPSGQALAVFTSGMSVNYSCEPGYSVTGQASIYCTASGTWSSPPPRCEEVLCIAPEIQNGRKVAGRGPVYRPRDTVRFECDPGYTLSGSRQIQCRDEGTWDPPVPVCTQVLLCPPPPVIVKGKHNAKPLAAFPSGTYANYSCEPGYALRGEASIYCTTSGTWSHPSPLCEEGCGVPTRLSFAELKREYKNQSSFPVGKTINYTCRPGYSRHPHMQSTITCLENRTWSEAFEFCKKKSCGHPGEPENGRVIVTDIHFGSTVNFTCEEGHRLIGRPYRRCDISGMRVAWTGDVPICERIPCLPPPDIPNGSHSGEFTKNFSFGSAVTYKCENGYLLTGEASIHCTTKDGLNGVWSARPPRCGEVRCPAPQIQNGRRVSGDRRVYLYNDSVTFECDPGYTVKGHSLSRCQTDDTWDPPLPVCEPEVLCIAPAIQNGRKVAGRGPVYRPKDTVRFECDPGYTLNGSRQIQCRDEGIWDPPVPACTQTTCVSPEVEHGRTNGVQRAYRPRDMVVFECDAGYTLSGSAETECQDDGRWDPRVPTCERTVQCVSPPAIANGKPSGQALAVFTSGMSVNYSCEPGYSVTGQASIYCTASGTWSSPPPRCEEVLCIAPEIQNGRKVAGRGPVYRPRDTVRFECDPGYTLSGSRQIQCRDEGTWDPPVPVCTQVLLCPPPPVIVKGKHNAKPLAAFPSGTYANYSCEPGYALRGEASIYCTTSGTWSHPSPLCEEGCGVPTRLSFAELKREYKNQSSFPVGKTINYTCRPGYSRHPHMQSTITCLENRTWSEAFEFCKKKSCGHPGEPENGRVIVTDIHFGSTVNFTCEEGHRLIGRPYRRCDISGMRVAWTGDVPICERIPCLPPPDIPNGSHSGEFTKNFSFGSAVTYKCENGYLLTGEASIHCTTKDGLNGVWSARPPRCGEVRCPAPQIQNGRRVSGDRRVYLYNDSVTFECDPGYTVKGHSLSRCQTDDTWDPPLPVCEPEVLCIAPEVQNGRKVAGHGPVYRPRDTVRFECDPGYTLNGSRQIQCRDEGIWDPPVPACTQTTCVSPAVEHGRTNGVQRAYRPRDMVVFECDAGYTLSGSAETQCQDDGRWDPPVPTCERKVLCIAPEIQNGRKVAGREPVYRPRDTVRFECDPGYTLNGSRLIQCQDDGNWDSPVPACTQVLLCPPPPVIVKGKHNAKPLAAFPSGTYANYSCEPGYALRGEASIYCTTYGTWSHPSPLCEDGCDVPTRLSFAELKSEYKNQSSFPVGKTINYTCRPGYSRHPHMQSTITCLENRTWSEALKFCKKKSCGHPGELENGRVIVTDTHFGSTVYFTCEEGHRLIGQPYRRCEISGMHVAWSGGDPICEQVRCPAPQIQNGRRVSGDRHVYLYNDSVTFECDPGYTMKGHSLSQCQTDDTWDPPLPVCELATCVSPEVENGRTNGVQPAYRPSDMVVFECDPGYTMNGSPETQCQNDGRWDPPVPVCERLLQCSFPPAITNGKPSVQALAVFTTGTSVNYSCEPGYSLNGQASIYCAASGTWSPPPPQCEEVLCIAPEIQNGRKVPGHRPVYRPRDTVRFECDPGYTLNASHQIQCQDDGTWDPPVPACTQGSYNFISVVLGIAGGALLLLLVTIIISRIMSKQNAGYYYTHENCKYRMPLAHITEQKNSFAP
ncbi:unnamed protein product [Lepidochelys olivacea]